MTPRVGGLDQVVVGFAAPDFEFAVGVALVAFDKDQVDGGHAGEDGGKVGFGAAMFHHQGVAVLGGEDDFARAGLTVAEGVLAGLV